MLKNFKGPLKINGTVRNIFNPGVTCPNLGLLTDITSKHLQSDGDLIYRTSSVHLIEQSAAEQVFTGGTKVP